MLAEPPPDVPALVAAAPAGAPIAIEEAIRFRPDKFHAAPLWASKDVRLMVFALEPGQSLPDHATPSEVLMLVQQGHGSFRVGDRRFTARQGDLVPVGPGVAHGFEAHGERLVVLAVIAPNPKAIGLEPGS